MPNEGKARFASLFARLAHHEVRRNTTHQTREQRDIAAVTLS
jgi:hypothetical protein